MGALCRSLSLQTPLHAGGERGGTSIKGNVSRKASNRTEPPEEPSGCLESERRQIRREKKKKGGLGVREREIFRPNRE